MKNYLTALDGVTIELLKAGNEAALTSYGMKEIVPVGLCPLLYHNLIPYILRFQTTAGSGGYGAQARMRKDARLKTLSLQVHL